MSSAHPNGARTPGFQEAILSPRLRDLKDLEVWFHPIFDLTTRNVAGAEALVRGVRPDGSLVLPAELLGGMDQETLEKVDLFVLHTVLDQARRWGREQGTPHFRLHVNLPPAHLQRVSYLSRAKLLLQRYPEIAPWLVMEVSEGQPFDPEGIVDGMRYLEESGPGFALDDFGTGYSNLHCLSRLPITTVKLDRSLVAEVTTSERIATLLREILHMTASLELEAVAEGVESPRQWTTLLQLGCRRGQGMFLAEPMGGLSKLQFVRPFGRLHLVPGKALPAKAGRGGDLRSEQNRPSGEPPGEPAARHQAGL